MEVVPKRICLICGSKAWGGLEINIVRLAGWLKDRGHSILLVCEAGSKVEAEAQKKGIPSRTLKFGKSYGNIAAASRLNKILMEEGFYLLIISRSKEINLAAFAKYFFNKKLKLAYMQQMQLGVDKRDFFHTFFYNRLDAWIAPLNWLADQVVKRTKISPSKVCVIPLGIETEKFLTAKSQREKIREKLNLPIDEFIVGIIGRLDPLKGQEYLIKAAAILKKKNINFKVLFVGDETYDDTRQYPAHLKKLSFENELERDIYLRPFMSNVELAYAALDIFVMATEAETYGMVTIESLAAGIPVIGSNRGGTPELLKNGKSGFLFKSQDENDLAVKLEALLAKMPDQEWIKIQQQYVLNTFNYTIQVEKLEKLLNSFE